MSIVSAIVLFVVIWAMTFLTVLPLRIKTQGETGDIVPGTHAGAPEEHHLRKKALITTAVAVLLWVVIAGIIMSGWISVRDMDWFHRMSPPRG